MAKQRGANPPGSLRELVCRLLRYHGFDARPSDDGSTVTAHSGALRVEIITVIDAPIIGECDLEGLIAGCGQSDRVLVVSLGNFSDGARALADKHSIQLWDRARLEQEAGRIMVAEIDVRPAPPGESLLDEMVAPKQVAAPAPPVVAELPGDVVMLGPAMTREQVQSRTDPGREGTFRYELRTLPKYCFFYEFVAGGENRPARLGAILVNSVTGEVSQWLQQEKLETPDDRIVSLDASLDVNMALEKAREMAVTQNTLVTNLKRETGKVTVYERRTIRPEPEQLRVTYKGLVLHPVWGVEGGNGAMMIDALTGEVIRQELFDRPAPDK